MLNNNVHKSKNNHGAIAYALRLRDVYKQFEFTFGLSFSSLMSNMLRSFNNRDEAGCSLLNKLTKVIDMSY